MSSRVFLSAIASVLALCQVAAAQQPAARPKAQQAPVPVRPPDTLMFTTDDFTDIQSRMSQVGSDNSAQTDHIEDASLYLSTILYFGPNDWTIWINGAEIGPNDQFQSFKVTDISPRSVELLVPLSAQGMRPVRLGPNQTFVAKSGIVVEGRVP